MAPLYVRPLWDKFVTSNDIKFTLISSDKGYEGIKTINPNDRTSKNKALFLDWRFVKNIYLRNALIYQVGVVKNIFKNEFDIYVFSGEMYTISTWVAALICRFRNKPVFFWGHGYYGNEGIFKKNIRLFFYKIAHYHFLYGNRARSLLINFGFSSERLFTVYNSLKYDELKKLYENRNLKELSDLKKCIFPLGVDYQTLLFIGRLTKKKKLYLLIDALYLQKKQGNILNCIFVGDGEEKELLFELVEKYKLSDNICFYGACYDDLESANLIMLADCCVSPGNVGLTAIHCMSLGTPVITHSNLNNQMPEVEAIVENETGFFFEEDNVESLSMAINHFTDKNQKQKMEVACLNIINHHFNPLNQFNIISNAVKKVYSDWKY